MCTRKEAMDFRYERGCGQGDGLVVWVGCGGHICYPLSYTINECLEEYCIENKLQFHRIQVGARLMEADGYGRFYCDLMAMALPPDQPLAAGVKQTNFSWARHHGWRRLILATGQTMYIPLRGLVLDTLKYLCVHLGWTFVSSNASYSLYGYGDGFLRYQE